MATILKDETLKLARNYLGLSQKDLAKKIGVSQGLISSIEKSRKPLTDEIASKLSLEFGNSFFFQNIHEPNLKVHYRASATVAKKYTDLFEARLRLMANHISEILEYVEIQENLIPRLDLEDFGMDPEYLALEVRDHFGLGRGPIKDFVRLLERRGAIVHFFNFDFISAQNKNFDGVSFYVSGVPVILVNQKIPGSRKMFTLAHELGHLIMHNHDGFIEKQRDIEKEANVFASEFLAPKMALRGEFSRLTLDKLFLLKSHWQISIAALLYKAKEMTLTQDQYRRWITRLAPYRKNEPYEFQLDEPVLLKKMIELTKEEIGGSEDFFNSIGMSEMIYHELYFSIIPKEKTKLRIVI